MSDTKELTWGDAVGNASGDAEDGYDDTDTTSQSEGWDAYRTWLSRTPRPDRLSRTALDPSLYTWKGYRNWSDKVKRNWVDRKDHDGD
ncbi:MAG: hypothetical protein AAFX58_01505 [Pseudomonadota bacterium]